MDEKIGIELDTIQTIIKEMQFMVEHEHIISDKNKNRYIAIIEALEKQVPTKAKLEGNIFYCPRCNFGIGDIKEKSYRFCPKYCSNCGQNTGGLKYFDNNH